MVIRDHRTCACAVTWSHVIIACAQYMLASVHCTQIQFNCARMLAHCMWVTMASAGRVCMLAPSLQTGGLAPTLRLACVCSACDHSVCAYGQIWMVTLQMDGLAPKFKDDLLRFGAKPAMAVPEQTMEHRIMRRVHVRMDCYRYAMNPDVMKYACHRRNV